MVSGRYVDVVKGVDGGETRPIGVVCDDLIRRTKVRATRVTAANAPTGQHK
jgi:hypothetical protein